MRAGVEAGVTRDALAELLPAGAARNALNAPYGTWRPGAPAVAPGNWPASARLDPVKTASPSASPPPPRWPRRPTANARRPLLKLKIGGADDLDRVEAVRAAAPRTRLVVDANEALDFDTLRRLAPEFARLGVILIEQPLAAGADAALEGYASR